MTGFSLLMPRTIHFGADACAQQLVPTARALGITAVFLVTGRTLARSGVVAALETALARAGIGCVVFARPGSEPTVETVDAAVAAWRATDCNGVVGLGGGSAMDLAKCVAVLARHGGRFADIAGQHRIPGPGLPLILIPTTAGSASEVTPGAVIVDPAAGMKRAALSQWLLPDAVIADPVLTVSSPPGVTADTGMDALVTSIEAYFSRQASSLSDLIALEAISLVGRHLARAVADGADLEARAGMLQASILTGMAFNLAGTGPVHVLSNPFSVGYGLSHGRSVAVMLPPVLRFNLEGAGDKGARLAGALGGRDPVAVATDLNRTLQIPPRLRDYGVPRPALPELAARAWENGQLWLQNNWRPLTQADVVTLIEAAW